MVKLHILGAPGSGKTTLAQEEQLATHGQRPPACSVEHLVEVAEICRLVIATVTQSRSDCPMSLREQCPLGGSGKQ